VPFPFGDIASACATLSRCPICIASRDNSEVSPVFACPTVISLITDVAASIQVL